MVAFIETQNVAHVMELDRLAHVWVSMCRLRLRVDPRDYRDIRAPWPLRHVYRGQQGDMPSVPWCRFCVQSVSRAVEDLRDCVLTPAGAAA